MRRARLVRSPRGACLAGRRARPPARPPAHLDSYGAAGAPDRPLETLESPSVGPGQAYTASCINARRDQMDRPQASLASPLNVLEVCPCSSSTTRRTPARLERPPATAAKATHCAVGRPVPLGAVPRAARRGAARRRVGARRQPGAAADVAKRKCEVRAALTLGRVCYAPPRLVMDAGAGDITA